MATLRSAWQVHKSPQALRSHPSGLQHFLNPTGKERSVYVWPLTFHIHTRKDQASALCVLNTPSYICYLGGSHLLSPSILNYVLVYHSERLYPLCACHESISVSNFGWRKESGSKVTVLNRLVVRMRWRMEIGLALEWIYYRISSPCLSLFLISVRHYFTSPSLSSLSSPRATLSPSVM